MKTKHTSPAIPTTSPKFVNSEAIARIYSVTGAAVRHWAKIGAIPSVKFQGTRRFSLEAVAAAIEGTK